MKEPDSAWKRLGHCYLLEGYQSREEARYRVRPCWGAQGALAGLSGSRCLGEVPDTVSSENSPVDRRLTVTRDMDRETAPGER